MVVLPARAVVKRLFRHWTRIVKAPATSMMDRLLLNTERRSTFAHFLTKKKLYSGKALITSCGGSSVAIFALDQSTESSDVLVGLLLKRRTGLT